MLKLGHGPKDTFFGSEYNLVTSPPFKESTGQVGVKLVWVGVNLVWVGVNQAWVGVNLIWVGVNRVWSD